MATRSRDEGMAGLVVAGLTTWQYEGTTAKKKHEHRISYLTGGGLLMEGREARPTFPQARAPPLKPPRQPLGSREKVGWQAKAPAPRAGLYRPPAASLQSNG